jgi:hypothetical protein
MHLIELACIAEAFLGPGFDKYLSIPRSNLPFHLHVLGVDNVEFRVGHHLLYHTGGLTAL